MQLGPSRPKVRLPSWAQFRAGVAAAGLPQLPLTLLNSVLAVSQLAGHLYPEVG